MTRCAGLFVVEKDARGVWRPEIRMSIPLLRRLDWPWPQVVCGVRCHTPEEIQARILEHELLHYKLWLDKVDDDFLNHAPKVKVIAHRAAGFDNIDAEACAKRGIPVSNSTRGVDETTDEHSCGAAPQHDSAKVVRAVEPLAAYQETPER